MIDKNPKINSQLPILLNYSAAQHQVNSSGHFSSFPKYTIHLVGIFLDISWGYFLVLEAELYPANIVKLFCCSKLSQQSRAFFKNSRVNYTFG